MASLSYYSNWETTHDHYLNFSETSDDASGHVMASPPFFPQHQAGVDDQLEAPVAAELLFGFNNHNFLLPESSLSSLFPFDPLFNSGEFTFSDNYVSLPPPPPQAAEYSVPQELEFQTGQTKRQKLYHHDHFPPEITQNCFDVFVPNLPLLQDVNPPPPPPEYSFPQELEFQANRKRQKLYHEPEITENCFGAFIPNLPLLQDFTPPPPPTSSSLPQERHLPELPSVCAETEAEKKNDSGEVKKTTLSAQSIAARERRRRIAEKTQELGKLIPGGQKMNTAEMFQAGYKYIKYMQAQLSVLQSCHHSSQESGETLMSQELETLVGSFLIQEKLYSNDKCLVPQKFIQSLPNAHQLEQAPTPSFDTKLNSDPIS